MHLTMVGTGSAFGKKFFNNSCLIETKDYNLLIDCGATVPLGLHQMKYDLGKLDGIFITHLHGDHVNGLEEIAFQMMYRYKKKLALFGEKQLLEELWDNCLQAGLRCTTEGYKTIDDYFDVSPIEVDPKTHASEAYDIAPGLSIDILRTPHIPQKNSYSLFINDEIFYSGDVRFDEQLVYHADLEREVNLILHDCQLHNLSLVHAYLGDLLKLPPQVQEKMWLMHYNDNMEDFVGQTGLMDFLEQHRRYEYKDGVLL